MEDNAGKVSPEAKELVRAAHEAVQEIGGRAELARRAELGREHIRQLDAVMPSEARRRYLEEARRVWSTLASEAEWHPLLKRFLRSDKVAATDYLLAQHGEPVLTKPQFLAEFGQNVALLSDNNCTSTPLERADLLARHALPPEVRQPESQYEPENVAAVRSYEDDVLAELGGDFVRDRNPLHAWEAGTRTAGSDRPVPSWVLNHLLEGARNLAAICDAVAGGQAVTREAEQAGRALGFGDTGSGRGSWFSVKYRLRLDRERYSAVVEEVRKTKKLYIAWANVAERLGCSTSTVERAYKRIKELRGETPDAEAAS